MPSTALKRIAKRLAPRFEVHGFQPATKISFERKMDRIVQAIEFQPGARHLSGRFTINFGWRFLLGPIVDPKTYEFWDRIGTLLGQGDLWFPEADDEKLHQIEENVFSLVVPFLDCYRRLEDIVAAYEGGDKQGELSRSFFGLDAGWEHYNFGLACISLGRIAKGKEELEKVINDHSAAPYDWVRERRDAANSILLSIKEPSS